MFGNPTMISGGAQPSRDSQTKDWIIISFISTAIRPLKVSVYDNSRMLATVAETPRFCYREIEIVNGPKVTYKLLFCFSVKGARAYVAFSY